LLDLNEEEEEEEERRGPEVINNRFITAYKIR
jgi:hypothetical protein